MDKSNVDDDKFFLSRLQELERETDFEFVLELIDIYCKETPKLIETIATALQSHDLQSLAISAHTLKGSSLNMGAKRMGALCLKLEEIGKSRQALSFDVGIKEIEMEFEHVKVEILAYKQSRS